MTPNALLSAAGLAVLPEVQREAAAYIQDVERVTSLAAIFDLTYAAALARYKAFCRRSPSDKERCYQQIVSGADW
jgi:hypothetical protein